MDKSWDSTGIANSLEMWREVMRVLKPGGHLLSFGGSRTYHRMACAIEDAGFEVRDQIMWVYGSGFPKSLNIGKAIDKQAGEEREVTREATEEYRGGDAINWDNRSSSSRERRDNPITKEAKKWEGWGTALKPAHEPIVLARKPLSEKTVAENVLRWGTGAINVDGCRVVADEKLVRPSIQRTKEEAIFPLGAGSQEEPSGRWPANFIHDGIEKEWSRFFYCAKASKSERNRGLEGFEQKEKSQLAGSDNSKPREELDDVSARYRSQPMANVHPTVKPVDLMRYLCKLITPPNGTVLDPFTGSGTTGIAAKEEGFHFIGIEREEEYIKIAEARISAAIIPQATLL